LIAVEKQIEARKD